MKTLVLYFSRTGQTGQVAKEIAKHCAADLEAVRLVHPTQSVWRSAWQALTRTHPPIHKPVRNPRFYDLVVIGAPVQHNGVAAPMRSYLQKYAERFNQVAFFCAESSGSPDSGFAEMSRLCGKPPAATLALEKHRLPVAAHKKEMAEFLAGAGLTNRLF